MKTSEKCCYSIAHVQLLPCPGLTLPYPSLLRLLQREYLSLRQEYRCLRQAYLVLRQVYQGLALESCQIYPEKGGLFLNMAAYLNLRQFQLQRRQRRLVDRVSDGLVRQEDSRSSQGEYCDRQREA